MSADNPLDPFVEALSNGDPVDWTLAESATDLHGGALRALKDIERIAGFSRRLQRVDPAKLPMNAPTASVAGNEPERWGDLVLIERIGAGAMGEVWRAWDSTLQRQVALKFLQRSDTNRETGSNLLREARALARIRHPSVVVVHGIAEHNFRVGMWMEYLDGATLASEIERLGALPSREVARIGLDLCSALETLESVGLVHRDIKPANIILEPGGRVVMTDFGLGWSPRLEDGGAGRGAGTPIFMAPELLVRETAPSPQSDLYAVGVTLWWALAGRPPFRAETLAQLKAEVADGATESLAAARPDAPPALVDAILWSMHPDQAQRPRSAANLAAKLRLFLEEISARSPVAPVASIAVLPFLNRGSEQKDEYFSDGLADEILNMLAKIRGLRVVARSSSFSSRGMTRDLATIGRKLGVTTLLDGTLRKAGRRIRISVQLIKVPDGVCLWSERYEQTLDDIFRVQDDIAESVVKALRTALLGEEIGTESDVRTEVARAAKGRGRNAEAHRLFLKGRYFLDRYSPEDAARGVELLKEAVTLDPDFALAWAELARAYVTQDANRWVMGGYELGRAAAKHALSLEPDLAEGHAVLGWIHLVNDWEWGDAERSIRLALKLAPGNATVLRRAAVLAWIQARLEEAIDLNEEAIEQDPLAPLPYINLGTALHAAGRLIEAEGAYRKAIELAPDRSFTRSALALVLLAQGRTQEALAEAIREPSERNGLFSLTIIHDEAGNSAASEGALQELIDKYSDQMPFEIAEAWSLRGEADRAFSWLERAYEVRTPMICDLKVSRRLAALHGDPRWESLMERMRLYT